MNTRHIIKAAMAVALLYGSMAAAQTFTYNSGDLLAAFRKSGSPDLIVDLGPAANYPASTFDNPSGPFVFTGVNSTLFDSVFGDMNGIYWSVFAYVDTTGSLGSANTLWYTVGRSDVNNRTVAPHSGTFNAQGYVTGEMGAIVDGTTSHFATVIQNQTVQLSSSLNEGGDPVSYTVGVGPYGDFNGTLKGVVENYTGDTFDSGTKVSDLYQLNPGAGNTGKYLGNFALGADGSFTFNPVPEPSTWAMLSAGMLALAAVRRFGRNK